MELSIEVHRGNQEVVRDLVDYLQEAGFECQREMRKALGWPEIIYVTGASLSIIDILYSWLKRKKRQEPNLMIVIVTGKDIRVNFNNVSSDEAKKHLQD